MKVIIAGPRDFFRRQELEQAIADALTEGIEITEVVSGKARGVDTMGEDWAVANGIPIKGFPADWKKHGKSAGFLRNRQMAEYGEALIALSYCPNPSPGTSNMIREAKNKNLKVHVHKIRRSSDAGS